MQQFEYGLFEIVEQVATDAPIAQLDYSFGAIRHILHEFLVNVEFGEVIDGSSDAKIRPVGQDVLQKRGLATPKMAGDERNR